MKKIREGYKMTELGQIPNEWEVKKLGEIFKLSSGNFLSQKNMIDGNYPVYGGNGINGYHNEFMFRESKLVIGRVGAKCGCVCLSKPQAWITDNALYISEKLQDFNESYMYYLLDNINLNTYANQNAQPVISGQKIYNIVIGFPNIKEQEKIASILSTVDEQIDNVDELIEKNKELKKGLMQQLLTKGIGHTKFKKTEIGDIPEEWEVSKLGSIVEVISGATPKTNINEYWDNGEIYWATPTDITSNGKYISITEKTITESGLRNCSAKLLPIGSILMSSRATIGERCINTIPMATNQGFKSLVCKNGIYNEFIYYYVDILKEKLIGLASGSTFLEVSKKVVEDIKVVVPSLKEQEKIASILSEVDKKIEEYENKKQKLEELKKGLMQQLLTGKIRV